MTDPADNTISDPAMTATPMASPPLPPLPPLPPPQNQPRTRSSRAPTPAPAAASTPNPAPRRRWLTAIVIVYALAVILGWLLMRYGGDRFWPATLLLFAPRWPALLPMVVLIPVTLLLRRRLLLPLLGLAVLIAWPIMQFNMAGIVDRAAAPPPPPPAAQPAAASSAAAPHLRVLTLNSHFEAVDAAALRKLIAEEKPDIVSLQEWYSGNKQPIFAGDAAHPYLIQNILALLASRYPARQISGPAGGPTSSAVIYYGYTIDLPTGPISFYNVHLASPHNSLSEVVHGGPYGVNRLRRNAAARWNEAAALDRFAIEAGGRVILAGDFNLPPDSPIFRHTFTDLTDAFDAAGFGYGWTYRTNRTDVRIDHILFGDDWRCVRCWVGPNVGSPHRPLLADLEAR